MLLKLMLSTLVLGLLTVTPTTGQVLQVGRCKNYQGSTNFTQEFIDKLKSEERSYLFAMSSGPTLACQRIKFFSNNTFFYSYADATQIETNYTGRYVATPQTTTDIGSIRLTGVPLTVLQSGFNGTRLRIVSANDEQLVAVSCLNLGLISIETVGGLISEDKYYGDKNNTIKRIEESVKSINFHRPEQIVSQSMSCVQSRENYIKIFDLLVKFGVIPNIPFLRELLVKILGGEENAARLYSAHGGFPSYQYPMNYPGGYPQQGGHYMPYGAIPQQVANFPQGASFSQSPYSQFIHPFYPQPQVPQSYQNNLYNRQVSQSLNVPQTFNQLPQTVNQFPQTFSQLPQTFNQVPQSIVYPAVSEKSAEHQRHSSPVGYSGFQSPSQSILDNTASEYGAAIPLLTNYLASDYGQPGQEVSRSDSQSLLNQFSANDPTYNPFTSPLMSD